MKRVMYDTLDLVSSHGVELKITLLVRRQVVWVNGLKSSNHHVPNLLATTSKMKFHKTFTIGKVGSIKMEWRPRIVDM
jgi:hypothetical protein